MPIENGGGTVLEALVGKEGPGKSLLSPTANI
jgi:hypothetical protein